MGNTLPSPGVRAFDFSITDRPETAPVYLLKLLPTETAAHSKPDELAHWMVVVDLEGRSDTTTIKGLELHLIREAQELDNLVVAGVKTCSFPLSTRTECQLLGRIQNIGGLRTCDWAYSLHCLAYKTFCAMAEKYDDEWRPEVNCQQFARKLLKDLGLSFNEKATGDPNTPFLDFCTYDRHRVNSK